MKRYIMFSKEVNVFHILPGLWICWDYKRIKIYIEWLFWYVRIDFDWKKE